LQELETQILLSSRLTFLSEETTKHLLDATTEVAKILNGLVNSLTTNH